MEQIVQVRRTNDDGTAQVIRIRESACSGDCHKCSGCGAAQQSLLFTANNPIGARIGEQVVVQAQSAPVLKAAAMLYLMPLGLFFIGYFLGAWLWQMGALMGAIAFAAGICLVAVYERRVLRRKNTVYTITGYPQGSQTKGDNVLD